MIALGATIRDAMLVVVFANILSAVVICLNGRAAARYHVGYPVLSRVTFGIYGSYFVVILRAILGIIWVSLRKLPASIFARWLTLCLGRCPVVF
jgi:NCS1 family nucleobase:cation symporter-1